MCALYRRGKVWWYDFTIDGRRIQQSTGLANKKAAEYAESKRKLELLERRAGIARRPLPPRFEEYLREFLAWSRQQHRPKTYQLHVNNCKALLRHFSGKWLDQISAAMVEDFKLARLTEARRNARDGSRVGPATVNRALTTLKLLFNHAVRGGLAVANPTEGVAFLQEHGERMRVLSFEEEWSYLQAAGQPLRDIARVILDTGMRPEEVFRLEVANLDFDRRIIFNPHGKTSAAKRTIPMTSEVWELLKRLAIAARGRFAFPCPRDCNKPIGSVRKAHDAAVVRAGIQDHFRLYDLRHTFASRAAMSGVDLPALAVLLGHTKIQMTMRYVHPSEEHKREAIGKVEVFKRAGGQKAAQNARESLQIPLQ